MRRKPQTISFWHGKLPHWEVVDGRYFVTIRLAGAIPEAGRRRIRTLSDEYRRLGHKSPRSLSLKRKIFTEMERWLDRALAVRHLEERLVANLVQEAIENRVNRGVWRMFKYVIMPNHIHLFFELLRPDLKKTIEKFKRWTGHEAAKILSLGEERFWQQEWFDHWSRGDEEDERIAAYIRKNPVAAGLVEDYRLWPYGSW
jgi:REP element-mobilizing transposase RayT